MIPPRHFRKRAEAQIIGAGAKFVGKIGDLV
jgi:hypothetical protein